MCSGQKTADCKVFCLEDPIWPHLHKVRATPSRRRLAASFQQSGYFLIGTAGMTTQEQVSRQSDSSHPLRTAVPNRPFEVDTSSEIIIHQLSFASSRKHSLFLEPQDFIRRASSSRLGPAPQGGALDPPRCPDNEERHWEA